MSFRHGLVATPRTYHLLQVTPSSVATISIIIIAPPRKVKIIMAGITVDEFRIVLRMGTDATKDALYNRIASSSPAELDSLIHGNTSDTSCWTALHCAASLNHSRFFRLLVANGANHRACDSFHLTILMVAANFSAEILQFMLEELNCDDDVNERLPESGLAPLHFATMNLRSAPVVELLLNHGADPNIATQDGMTPLIFAAIFDATASAQLLLEMGAELHATTQRGENAMHMAAGCGRASFVQWLWDVGAHDLILAKAANGDTPWNTTIRAKWRKRKSLQAVMNLLLQLYKDNIATQEGDFGLHYILRTALYDNGRIVLPLGTLDVEHMSLLLTLFVAEREKVNPIATADQTGDFPLHIACRQTKIPIDVVRFLVEHDPTTVRQRDSQGNLPIHVLCASHPLLDAVQYLHSQYEASVTMTNQQGCSPFAVASLASASLDVLIFLMQANPGVALASFRCPAHAAIM